MQSRHLLEDVLRLSPSGEIQSGGLRTSLMSLLTRNAEVKNTRFNGNTWANMRSERFATLLAHLRKFARDEQAMKVCASKLPEKAYPVMLATPPGEKAALCHKEEEWDPLQEGEKTPLTEGKGKKRKAKPLEEGSAKAKPSTMWRRDGALVPVSKAGEEAAASSGSRRPWKKVRVTEANKPKPRAYITACHESKEKLRLNCEVSIPMTNQYKQVIYLIKEQLERKDLTKEEALELREKLRKQYPTRR